MGFKSFIAKLESLAKNFYLKTTASSLHVEFIIAINKMQIGLFQGQNVVHDFRSGFSRS